MDSKDDHEGVSVKDALDAIRKDIEGLRNKKNSTERKFHVLTNKIDPGGNIVDLESERVTQKPPSEEKESTNSESFSRILEKNIVARLDKKEKIEEIVNYFLHKILSVWLNRTLSESLSRILSKDSESQDSSEDSFDGVVGKGFVDKANAEADKDTIRLTNIVKNDFI